MKPMLAHAYDEKRVVYPVMLQPKLNGIRAIWHDGRLWSRDEHKWRRVMTEHLMPDLSQIPKDLILDGELYRHGWTLQRINSAMAVNRETPTTETPEVEFHVFDLVDSTLPFCMRYEKLRDYISGFSKVKLVHAMKCGSKHACDLFTESVEKDGYEGVIYRVASCVYNEGKRSYQLLKRKKWLDDVFEIIDAVPGEPDGKYANCLGALVCKTRKGGVFHVGTLKDFSESIRFEWWEHTPLDKKAHVKFECYSEAGIPLKPVLLELV